MKPVKRKILFMLNYVKVLLNVLLCRKKYVTLHKNN